jgi:hypothetical protein
MSQFDWPITPKKLKLWKLPKRECSILKSRIQWTVHSPHKTQLEKNKDFPPPTRKRKGRPFTSWHTSHWLHGHSIPKIGRHYFWPELSTVPRAIIPDNLFLAWLHYTRNLHLLTTCCFNEVTKSESWQLSILHFIFLSWSSPLLVSRPWKQHAHRENMCAICPIPDTSKLKARTQS